MTSPFLLPYYHPSTVVFLDDNHEFLRDLEVRLPERMAYILHHDPAEALVDVNRYAASATLATRCFSLTEYDPRSRTPSVIEFDVGLIEEEVTSIERFDRTSVVVVDYAMPAMNGLEFCERIDDPYVKKMLLTGAADEKLAVTAFNDGLIDRFVLKNQPDSLEQMLRFTGELQIAHFRRQQTVLAAALSLNPPPFLEDHALIDHITRLAARRGYVEHYLVGDPPGFMLLTAAGRVERLVVLSDEDFDRQTRQVEDHGAPQRWVEAMQARTKVLCLYESLVGQNPSDYPWEEFSFDAWRVDAAVTWWLALIPHPPVHIDFDADRACLDAFLDRLDAA